MTSDERVRELIEQAAMALEVKDVNLAVRRISEALEATRDEGLFELLWRTSQRSFHHAVNWVMDKWYRIET